MGMCIVVAVFGPAPRFGAVSGFPMERLHQNAGAAQQGLQHGRFGLHSLQQQRCRCRRLALPIWFRPQRPVVSRSRCPLTGGDRQSRRAHLDGREDALRTHHHPMRHLEPDRLLEHGPNRSAQIGDGFAQNEQHPGRFGRGFERWRAGLDRRSLQFHGSDLQPV